VYLEMYIEYIGMEYCYVLIEWDEDMNGL